MQHKSFAGHDVSDGHSHLIDGQEFLVKVKEGAPRDKWLLECKAGCTWNQCATYHVTGSKKEAEEWAAHHVPDHNIAKDSPCSSDSLLPSSRTTSYGNRLFAQGHFPHSKSHSRSGYLTVHIQRFYLVGSLFAQSDSFHVNLRQKSPEIPSVVLCSHRPPVPCLPRAFDDIPTDGAYRNVRKSASSNSRMPCELMEGKTDKPRLL